MLVSELIERIKKETKTIEDIILETTWNDTNYKELIKLIDMVNFNCNMVKEIKKYQRGLLGE